MGKAEELRNAVSTIKEYCDNMKCRRHEKCLFYRDRNYLGGCMMAHAPMYWSHKTLKTRREVFLERFPNAKCAPSGTCAAYVFGGDCIGTCTDCWDLPAPDECQEELE